MEEIRVEMSEAVFLRDQPVRFIDQCVGVPTLLRPGIDCCDFFIAEVPEKPIENLSMAGGN